MPRRLKVLLFAITLGLGYNDWLLAPLVNPRLSLRYSMISEISAQMQPYAWLFHAIDILTGILTMLALPYVWRFLQKLDSPWRQILFGTIASIGVDSIIDTLLPISCAPSMDTACNLAQSHSLLTTAHMVESTLIGIVEFVAPLLWMYVYKTKRRAIAQVSIWFVAVQVAVGLTIVLTRAIHHDQAVGLYQRFYQAGIGVWVAYVLYTAIAPRQVKKPELETAPAIMFAED